MGDAAIGNQNTGASVDQTLNRRHVGCRRRYEQHTVHPFRQENVKVAQFPLRLLIAVADQCAEPTVECLRFDAAYQKSEVEVGDIGNENAEHLRALPAKLLCRLDGRIAESLHCVDHALLGFRTHVVRLASVDHPRNGAWRYICLLGNLSNRDSLFHRKSFSEIVTLP